jgi:uncharacterized protein (TIGR00369 family)
MSNSSDSSSNLSVEKMQRVFDAIRHCVVLGLKVTKVEGKQLTVALPYSDIIIGNPDTGVIHGGALTTLLDSTCGLSLPLAIGEFQIAPTLDLRIDYMTAATPGLTVYGRAEVYRITQNVIFAKGIAFQDNENKPIAHCVATFMRLPKDITDSRAKNIKGSHD